MKTSKTGYKKNSEDRNEPYLKIPSGMITMNEDDGTPLKKGPILGRDNLGNQQLMLPGGEYMFPGNYVYEIPMIHKQLGGDPSIPDLSNKGWLHKYQDGGSKTKIYTDLQEFNKAKQAQQDSSDMYNSTIKIIDAVDRANERYPNGGVPLEEYKKLVQLASNNWQYRDETYDPITLSGDIMGSDGQPFMRMSSSQLPRSSDYIRGQDQIELNIPGPTYVGIEPTIWNIEDYAEPNIIPVYQPEIKPIASRPGMFEVSQPGLAQRNAQLPVNKFKPIMKASQRSKTGQYQAGNYVYNPETKGWDMHMFSPETQRENMNDVKVPTQFQDGGIIKIGTKLEMQPVGNTYQIRRPNTDKWTTLNDEQLKVFKETFKDYMPSDMPWSVEKVMKGQTATQNKPVKAKPVEKVKLQGPTNPLMADVAPNIYSAITGVELPEAQERTAEQESEKYKSSPYFHSTPYTDPKTAVSEYVKHPDYALRYKDMADYSSHDVSRIQKHLEKSGYFAAARSLNPEDYKTKDRVIDLQKLLLNEGLLKDDKSLSGKLDKSTLDAVAEFNIKNKPYKLGEMDSITKDAISKYKNKTDAESVLKIPIGDPTGLDPKQSDILMSAFEKELEQRGFFTGQQQYNFTPKDPGEEKIAYNFRLNPDSTSPFGFCSKYVNKTVCKEDVAGQTAREDLGFVGPAWMVSNNLVNKGGKIIFNGLQERKSTNFQSDDEISQNIKSTLSNSDLQNNLRGLIGSGNIYDTKNPTQVKPGDVVNIFYEGSTHTKEAYDETGPDNKFFYTTHVGLVKADESGNLYVEHNIGVDEEHGKVEKDSIKDFLEGKVKGNGKSRVSLISGITRPNYYQGVDNDVQLPISGIQYYQTEHGKLNPSGAKANPDDWAMQSMGGKNTYDYLSTIENNKKQLLKDIPITETEFDKLMRTARIIPTLETYSGQHLKEDTFKRVAGEALGFDEASKGFTNIKDERNLNENLRTRLFNQDDTQLNDPVKSALPTFYVLSKNYLYLKEFAAKNKIPMTSEELAKVAGIAYNQSMGNVASELKSAGSFDKYIDFRRKRANKPDGSFPYSKVVDLYDKQTMKQGGSVKWLHKYQPGGGMMTYASNPEYFDNHAVYDDNPKANDYIRKVVYAGTHGWDPTTRTLTKLDKPVNVPAATQERATENYGKKSYSQRFNSPTPAGKEVRETAVRNNMDAMLKNPALYAPAAIAAGAFVGPAAASGIGAALEAPLVFGSTVVPGITAGSTLGALGAGMSTQQILDPNSAMRHSLNVAYENPNTQNILNAVGETGLTGLGFVGLGIGKSALQGTKAGANMLRNDISNAGKYLTTQTPLKNTYKINPWAFKADPKMGYRILGDEGYKDALATGVLRAKQIPGGKTSDGISLARNTNRNPNTGKMQSFMDRPYFADGIIDERYGRNYLAEVNKANNDLVPIPTHKGIAPSVAQNIPIENANFYKSDWLRGYKKIDVPKQMPGSPNASVSSGTNNLTGNFPRNISELSDSGFKQDPYYHMDRFNQKQVEVAEHLESPEGRKRIQNYIDNNPHLQNLNKSVDDIINDFWKTNFTIDQPVKNPNTLEYEWKPVDPNNAFNAYWFGYNKPSHVSMGQNYSPYDAQHIIEHEFAHLFQRGAPIKGVDDVLANISLKNRSSDKTLLEKLNEYNPFNKKEDVAYSTTNDKWYGKGYTDGIWSKQKDYWLTGSGKQEKAAFAAEVRENLLQRGLLKNRYDEITPELLEKHYNLYHNTTGDKYRLRLYDIMQKDKKNFKFLSNALNKMPVAIPAAIGTGAIAAGAQQQKYGGWLDEYQDGGPENNPYETQQLANNTRESLQSEYARIARMQQDALNSMQSHDEAFDNQPFCTVLPNGQSYCATRATELLRKSGYPVKQIASSRVLKQQLTPEKGWYPTDYNNLQPADIALAERPGYWHTMLSTGNASNVHPFLTQDVPSMQQKGFFWDSGEGNSWGFHSPANEQELAKWIDPKAMKYYTYQGNIPGLESQYNEYLNKVKENPAPKMQSRPASGLKKGGSITKNQYINNVPLKPNSWLNKYQ